MKNVLLVTFGLISALSFGQNIDPTSQSEQLVLDNDEMSVVEFVAEPQGQVCGKDMHHHKPHLTILLSDAKVVITTPEGKSQEVEAPYGTALWSEEETHAVINKGNMPTRMILVFPKN
ncbi:hypothetical protein [Flagellimonas lutimaris]|uniref:hypothetical protein n=1 Tax=Flagellimonas lutimaris TaxID=475082 RepID=UPI003F5CC675